ncbi:MAG: undecaprenyl-diphosphate phosphatase [Nanoarchaeota archaeon]|nr:undecaprenyl-diphosphate phosphatase [Nanoarchaeota archaeon]
MVSLIQAIILGIIQGITEWFPISSSGHLALIQNIFNLKVPVVYDILLHLGTALVILIKFRKDILNIILLKEKKLLTFIIIGSIATAIIGFTCRDLFKSFFYNLTIIGIAFLITGILLTLTKNKTTNKNLNYKSSFLIGLAQGFALIPGISRSGSTISVGILKNINKNQLIKYSFILSLPAVLGAVIFEINNINITNNLTPILVGALISLIVGYISLTLVIKIIKKGNFNKFSYYCFIIGIITLIISFL